MINTTWIQTAMDSWGQYNKYGLERMLHRKEQKHSNVENIYHLVQVTAQVAKIISDRGNFSVA